MSFLKDLAKLKGSDKYADLTITCRDREWKVHLSIICSASDVFAKMCEPKYMEGQTRKVDLPEDDPDAIDGMIDCIYEFDFVDGTKSATKSSSTKKGSTSPSKVAGPSGSVLVAIDDSTPNSAPTALLVIARVFAAAEKYNVASAKMISLRKTRELTKGWAEYGYDGPDHDFVEALRFVWNEIAVTETGLREIYLGVIRASLRMECDLVKSDEMVELIREGGDFAAAMYEVNRQMTEPTKLVYCSRIGLCSNCGVAFVFAGGPKRARGSDLIFSCKECRRHCSDQRSVKRVKLIYSDKWRVQGDSITYTD